MIGGAIESVIGHGANHLFGWYKENIQSSPERKFICAELVFLLEYYAVKFADAVQDGGEPNGNQGEYEMTTKNPDKIDYSLVKGSCKSLKSKITYEICSLPVRQSEAIKVINFAGEYSSSPPEHREFFEESQYQFALLGLKAANIASEIRQENGFPDTGLATWAIPAFEESCNKSNPKD
ncbi:hypothetical protein QTN38_010655 [Enterobacter cloacae subsp. cloacae]|uniref:hypothetical protein n=1 Tax=Enterobacter cloacae TaxID=550 RepID=UPI0025B14BFC|nr:hypothetical protein [Enterobacter cloacae]WLD34107.1 hypothetical protein QTN38_010655 [Enterobacter cloacae subsp. cloacae]